MNRDDYTKSLVAKKDETSSSSSKDFKVALAAMISDDDYRTFENHFFGRRGTREDESVY